MPKVKSNLKLAQCRRSTQSNFQRGNTPLQIVNHVKKEFGLSANKDKAAGMKKYMRNKFEFYGLQATERRTIERQVMKNYPKLNASCLWEVMKLAWSQDRREMQYFAVECAIHNKNILSTDKTTCLETVENIKNFLVSEKSWWDTVDSLSGVVGFLVSKYPADLIPVMDQWIDDSEMWLRRSAILHQLKYCKETDEDRLFRYCLQRAHEKEFFIQKAMGWALRTYFSTNSRSVRAFVKKNECVLPKLTVKEALKHA
ncbi:uncharacterized protein LOC106181691 [Lingula anatina]|uniref:Uncharacterized protein LOC106181691 n=1 Tax=Lingula anatina TaxID=7574 RepID=A0A1S3KG40_LINAN|nr:uncharacterized protein LOC106181691 [Lingula anatina]|eukprot:XP_013421605.1 uncharacterized protein LOC106181691 [Lingula anatina]